MQIQKLEPSSELLSNSLLNSRKDLLVVSAACLLWWKYDVSNSAWQYKYMISDTHDFYVVAFFFGVEQWLSI